ncbi:MAG: hypothetical protein HYW47_07900 [Deltaproteobacteria bacterium]|nr:hypothetical protein [Deltaproteobacteria bacterium]
MVPVFDLMKTLRMSSTYLVLAFLIFGCSQSRDNGTQSLSQNINTSFNQNPCGDLKFSGNLTTEAFIKIIECLDRNGAISKIKSLLLSEPQYFVEIFNDIFQDKNLRKDAVNLFNILKNERVLDETFAFLSAFLGSEPLRVVLERKESRNLLEFLLNDNLHIIHNLSKIISSPYFSQLENILDESLHTGSFLSLAHSLSFFLTDQLQGQSGSSHLVGLLEQLSDIKPSLLSSHEAFLFSNQFFVTSFLKNLGESFYKNPSYLSSSYKLTHDEWVFDPSAWALQKKTFTSGTYANDLYSPLSALFYKLLNSKSIKLSYNHQTDFEILLEMVQYFNRPFELESPSHPHLLKSLVPFLGNLLSFFNDFPDDEQIEVTEENPEKAKEEKIKRMDRMATYYALADVLTREIYDTTYQKLSKEEKIKTLYHFYKEKFKFETHERFKNIFTSIKPRVESFVVTMPKNPITLYLRELDKTKANVLLSLLSKADAVLQDPAMQTTLVESVKNFLEFNKPVDDFLTSEFIDPYEEDPDHIVTWLEETLRQLPGFASEIPKEDTDLYISIIRTSQIHISLLQGAYFDKLPLDLLGNLLVSMKSTHTLDFVGALTQRLSSMSHDTLKSLCTILYQALTSHFFDRILEFLVLQSENGALFDKLGFELFASFQRRENILSLEKFSLNNFETFLTVKNLQKTLWAFRTEEEKNNLIQKINDLSSQLSLPKDFAQNIQNIDLQNETRLITPLLVNFENILKDPHMRTQLVQLLEALGSSLQNQEYLKRLIVLYKKYKENSPQSLWPYFKNEKRLETLLKILNQASQSEALAEATEFLKKIIDNGDLKGIFETLFRVLELGQNPKGT